MSIEKEIRNWRKNHHGLRFGQWLWNLMAKAGKWQAPEANPLFFIDDEDLADIIKRLK